MPKLNDQRAFSRFADIDRVEVVRQKNALAFCVIFFKLKIEKKPLYSVFRGIHDTAIVAVLFEIIIKPDHVVRHFGIIFIVSKKNQFFVDGRPFENFKAKRPKKKEEDLSS